MINKTKKKLIEKRRVERVRYKLKHNGERPRLVFNRTNRYLIAQVIDDSTNTTLAYAITSEKTFPIQGESRKNKLSATELGKIIALRATEKGVKQVMLDRSGMVYHGKIAAFADAARENGLEF
jgi:large subunit ribosomal protein L18